MLLLIAITLLLVVLALGLFYGYLPSGRLRLAWAYRRHRGLRQFFRALHLPTLWLYEIRPVGGGVGELTIKNWTAQNKANAALQPYTCVDIDAANTNSVDTSVVVCSASGQELIGVCYDKARLDPSAAVIKNSGVTVMTYGFARVLAAGVIAAGAYVSTNAAGQAQTQAKAGAGVQLVPIIGRALTASGGAGDRIVVALMIGSRV